MRKSVLGTAIAGTLCWGAALAQSSVTIFGIADVGVTHGTGSVASRTLVSTSQFNGSRIGFRGVEDLGGGLQANFWLEAGLNVDTGAGAATNTNNQTSGAAPALAGGQGLTFNRTAYVGLSNASWGQIRLGRDYTPTFVTHAKYDPTAIAGVGTSQTAIGALTIFAHPAGIRASNTVQYISPVLAGFTGGLMLGLGENASNAGATRNDGNYSAARVGYQSGAIDVSLAAAKYSMDSVGDIMETVLGGSYTFGAAKVALMHVRNTTGLSNDMKGSMLALSYSVGSWDLRTSVSNSQLTSSTGASIGGANKFMVGGIYNLSRRTGIYATYATLENRDGAAFATFPGISVSDVNARSSGFDVGIRHAF